MTSGREGEEMRVDPQRAKVLIENINGILQRIHSANTTSRPIRLIAVSKLKPANDILALHRPSSSPRKPTTPIQHFGENYAQELLSKADILPRSIRWHFIGALQTNKCKGLARDIRNLECVSGVDSSKKADELEKGRKALVEAGEYGKDEEKEERLAALHVHVQVNTSGEESKSGVEPVDAVALCRHIVEKCPHLRLRGLMTIGAIARSKAATAETENEDFVKLREVRNHVEEALASTGKGEGERLELSMGMSADFEAAIRQGSDEVRVGSEIFGERPARGDAKLKEDVEAGES